jgi:hypothetical protein
MPHPRRATSIRNNRGAKRGANWSHSVAPEPRGANISRMNYLVEGGMVTYMDTRNEQVVGSIPTGGSRPERLIRQDPSSRVTHDMTRTKVALTS